MNKLSKLKNIIYEYDSLADEWWNGKSIEEYQDALDSLRNNAIRLIDELEYSNLKEYIDELDSSNLKEYYVYTYYRQWNNMWIVLAKNKTEAINKVYDKYIKSMNEEIKIKNKEVGYFQCRPCYKKELYAKNIKELHKEYGDVVCFNN